MILTFDTHGNKKQKECAVYWNDDVTDEILYGGAKGGAKSFTGCSLTLLDALTYPDTMYFVARKTLTNLRKFTIPSIHEVLNLWEINSNYYKYNGQDNYFEFYNKSRLYLLDAKYLPSDPDYHRFGSMQMTRGWIEEGGEFERACYEALAISIGRWNNEKYNLRKKLLITANPAKNFLYKDFYLPNKQGNLEQRKKMIQALVYDNKMLDKGYIENLENTLKGATRERLLGGNWEYDDDPTALCDYNKILEIFKNDHVPKGEKYITADIARFGSDKMVIMVWDGWNVIEIHEMAISKITEIQALINALRMKHAIPRSQCIADEDGVGGGVVDNCEIKGFTNNAKPFPEEISEGKMETPNYQNIQTQCLYHLARKINKNEVNVSAEISDTTKDLIVEELETIKSDNKDVSKLKVINKDKVKELIGRSPDYRDALLMRVFFDLEPKNETFFF